MNRRWLTSCQRCQLASGNRLRYDPFWVSHCHNALDKYVEVAMLELTWRWFWIKLYGQRLTKTNTVQFSELVPN